MTLISDLRARHQRAGCFVFGHDHDTLDVFDQTVQFSIDAAIDLLRFAILTPFPARRCTCDSTRPGGSTKNWELYDGQHVVLRRNR
jgi:hypothetical protein